MIKSWPEHGSVPQSFAETPYEVAAQENRCAPHQGVNIPATLRSSSAKGFHTFVHDLSLGGFSCNAPNRMHTGTICWLTLPGLEALQSEVIWWERGQVGCAFAKLLSPIIHENIVKRYPCDDGNG